MILRISSNLIASSSRVYFGCCSSNPSTSISDTARSWAAVSSVPVRNLTTSLLPPRLQPQPAAPTSAAPASPKPPSLRKPLRLTALGICRSPALLALAKRFSNHPGCHAPTWIKRLLPATGTRSRARFSRSLASLWSGTLAQPQRDVSGLHRLSVHQPLVESFLHSFSVVIPPFSVKCNAHFSVRRRQLRSHLGIYLGDRFFVYRCIWYEVGEPMVVFPGYTVGDQLHRLLFFGCPFRNY